MSNDDTHSISLQRRIKNAVEALAALISSGKIPVSLDSDIEIGAVELKDGATDNRAVINAANTARSSTDKVILVQPLDANGVVGAGSSATDDEAFPITTGKGTVIMGVNTTDTVDSGDQGALRMTTTRELAVYDTAPQAPHRITHWTPSHGTATYANSSSLTLTGFNFVPDDSICMAVSIYIKNLAGTVTKYEQSRNGISLNLSAGTLSIVGATPFLITDTAYRVALSYIELGDEVTLDAKKNVNLNPDYSRNTDPETISSAQVLTGSDADLGPEIDCRGYNWLYIYFMVDINDSLNVRLGAKAKHTGDGSEEFIYPATDFVCANTTVESGVESYIEFDADSDYLYLVKMPVNNALPVVQLRSYAGTAGAGPCAITCYVTKGY